MAVDRAALVAVPRDVVAVLRARNVPFMAGSIAYNAFVSLIPLLILAFVLVTAAGDQQLAGRVVEATEGVLPQSAQEPLGRRSPAARAGTRNGRAASPSSGSSRSAGGR